MISRDTFERFFIILASAYLALYCYAQYVPYSMAWNITASIPKGLYFARSAQGQVLERGQIACFNYEAPTWAQPRHYFPHNFQLCKPVAALPGDEVARQDDTLLVKHYGASKWQPLAAFGKSDSAGRPLPQDALTGGELARGQYLLVAPAHANSLDSRYLGPIGRERITRTLIPLITW